MNASPTVPHLRENLLTPHFRTTESTKAALPLPP
jgi:hypothetical protein